MYKKLTFTSFSIIIVLMLLGQLSYIKPSFSDTYQQLELFGDVFEKVQSDYVEEPNDVDLIESAINGMLNSLDPHSRYLNPKSLKEMKVQTKGEFGGLGIEVTLESGFIKVIAPIDDTPAYKAGILTGDFITHLDDEPVLGMTLNEAVELMRGLINTKIKLTIQRPGRDTSFDVTIVRAKIKIGSVKARLDGQDIVYIRITSFSEKTSVDLKKAFSDIFENNKKNLVGVVLDLRNNPGGLLDQAIEVSDSFLEQGEIVSTRGRRFDSIQRFNARGNDIAEGLPMIVLINGGSASASEIVAGALQDHKRGIVLGTRSFGKGSVQTVIPLGGQNGAIRLTTARYFTPSGRSIQAKGIEPDIIVVPSRLEKLEEGRQREVDLRGRLEAVDEPSLDTSDSGTIKENLDEDSEKGEIVPEVIDYQLLRALDLLRGFQLLSSITEN